MAEDVESLPERTRATLVKLPGKELATRVFEPRGIRSLLGIVL